MLPLPAALGPTFRRSQVAYQSVPGSMKLLSALNDTLTFPWWPAPGMVAHHLALADYKSKSISEGRRFKLSLHQSQIDDVLTGKPNGHAQELPGRPAGGGNLSGGHAWCTGA